MVVILHRGERRTNEHPAAVTAIYTVLGIVLMLQWLVDIIAAERAVLDSLFFVSVALRMMVAVGALVLVHNLYTMSAPEARWGIRGSEEHTSELQSLMRISYAVFCLKKKNTKNTR